MRRLTNINPVSLAESVARLEADGTRAAVVGGGTDLLGMLKDDLAPAEVLINLNGLRDRGSLDRVEIEADGICVGGLVTLTQLSRHPLVGGEYRVLAEAAGSAATPQIRNVGTIAGNICQRPWCWYFRQNFPCYKHGGNRCFSRLGENEFNAIFGGGPSYIVHPSDTAPALIALGASFRIVGPAGERLVPASDFFTLPRVDVSRENILEPAELLADIHVPSTSGLRSTYAKVLDREAWTHAVISVALTLEMDGDVVRRAGVVLGGVAPIPWQLEVVQEFLAGQRVTASVAAEAGRLAVEGARPLSKNGYKVTLTENLVRRTLQSLASEA